jgi:hypothetical protein
MAKISLGLAAIALSATLASAFPSLEQGLVIKFDEPHVKYYMTVVRAFSDGYGRGLYTNESETTS